MNRMFYGATSFEKTLSWDISNVPYKDLMFDGSKGSLLLSTDISRLFDLDIKTSLC